MPKKTKKQKLLAELRRHSAIPPAPVAPPNELKQTTQPVTFRLQEVSTPMKRAQMISDSEELTIIKKDLMKTIVLAMVAITIELGVHSLLRGT